jgi:hypothetical protein
MPADPLIPLHRAIAALRATWGAPRITDTLVRWHQAGLRDRDGRRVHLKLFKLGGRWHIKQTDFDAFLCELNGREAIETPRLDRPRAGRGEPLHT